ncbi:MAG: helix-turn-helix transcriptional regulator [Chitinophagaceae bacterium]|nr:helix-turn-helix transcriptional regulator [Chitinophagaceae bacterium]
MNYLQKGQFHGQTNKTIHLDGIIITDTEYTHDKVDWHYHENAYFTFILEGNVIEGNKKEKYNCSAGSLLFHNWEDAHYNIKPKGFTRGFHVELQPMWFNDIWLDIDCLQGSIDVTNPDVKILFYKIFKECKSYDDMSALAVRELLIRTFTHLRGTTESRPARQPQWVDTIRQILHDDCCSTYSLEGLGQTGDIHPVHLSRDFHKYFHCGVSEYVRKLRVQKSLTLLSNATLPLTTVALDCGFADQSHFTRCFKEMMQMTPFKYRKLLLS